MIISEHQQLWLYHISANLTPHYSSKLLTKLQLSYSVTLLWMVKVESNRHLLRCLIWHLLLGHIQR